MNSVGPSDPAGPSTPTTALRAWHTLRPYAIAGVSGMFSMLILQPVDTVKVRLQLQGEGVKGHSTSARQVAANIVKTEGLASLYKGMSAAMLRQATYTTARMGAFNAAKEKVQDNYYQGTAIPTPVLAVLGFLAGGAGAVVGTPADLALVRMQADGMLPAHQRRNYTGVTDAMRRVVAEEGTMALWKGCAPTVARAMAVNMGLFSSFEKSKDMFVKDYGFSKQQALWSASMVAGGFASVLGLPFDFVKTRIQKQKPDAHGKLPYTGPIDCVLKVIRSEGPMTFYRGLGTFYIRIAPAVSIQLVVNEWLTGLVRKLEAGL